MKEASKKKAIQIALGLATAAFVSAPFGLVPSTMAGRKNSPGGRTAIRTPGIRGRRLPGGRLPGGRLPGARMGTRAPGVRKAPGLLDRRALPGRGAPMRGRLPASE